MKYFFLTALWVSIFAISCSTDNLRPFPYNVVVTEDGVPMLYSGGPILTMASDEPDYVEALVTDGEEIVFTGSLEEAKKSFPVANQHDLAGRVLMPGFIEPHVHPSLAATVLPNEIIAPYDWQLPGVLKKGVTTQEGFMDRLKESIKNHQDKSKMLLIWGYHPLWHGDLSKDILDEVGGGIPIGIIHRSFHELYVNQNAVDLIGLKKEQLENHPQIDWDAGHFYESGWMSILPQVTGVLFDPVKLGKGMAMMKELVTTNGITTIAEPGFPSTSFLFEYGLYKQGISDVPYDLKVIPNGNRLYQSKGSNEAALAFIDSLSNYNSSHIQFLPKQVKLFADGAMYSQLMQMKEGYDDGHHGQWMTALDLLKEQIEFYWSHGFKIHIHANGDLGIQELIDIVEPLYKANPFDHRFTLHHMGYFSPDQAEQMKELKMEASVNPYYLWALSDKYSTNGLGKDRAEYMVRVGSLVERSIPVSFHSDFSMAPLSPLTLAWVAINRVTSQGTKVSQEERIPVYEGLRAITIDAARTLNLEQEIGSLEEGKVANLVILDSDPMKVDPMKIKDIIVEQTIFKGSPVQ